MSLITAKGSQAAESAAKSSVDLEKVMIRLKDGQSVKVRLLSPEDYVEYQAISAFDLGIFTQPSREPLGEKDYFVEAGKIAKAGKLATPALNEKFSGLYPKKRYIVAMADVDIKDVRFWDCSKGQFNSLVAAIEDYKEIIEDGDEAVFTFKRTGQKTETSYSLAYIPKPKAPELEGFHSFDGKTVEIADFEAVLQPRTDKLQVSVLKEAGFPVEEFFPEISLDENESTESTEETEATPLDGI